VSEFTITNKCSHGKSLSIPCDTCGRGANLIELAHDIITKLDTGYNSQLERPYGECPFCGSATNPDDLKSRSHFFGCAVLDWYDLIRSEGFAPGAHLNGI
jgi:hypothetical protein